VLEFTRRLQHPPQKVWRALTEPDHLAAWFPSTIEGNRAAGARLHFGFREMEAAPFDGEMLIFEPPSVMELRWGDEILRFEVRPDGDGSVLSFRNIFDELGKAATAPSERRVFLLSDAYDKFELRVKEGRDRLQAPRRLGIVRQQPGEISP